MSGDYDIPLLEYAHAVRAEAERRGSMACEWPALFAAALAGNAAEVKRLTAVVLGTLPVSSTAEEAEAGDLPRPPAEAGSAHTGSGSAQGGEGGDQVGNSGWVSGTQSVTHAIPPSHISKRLWQLSRGKP